MARHLVFTILVLFCFSEHIWGQDVKCGKKVGNTTVASSNMCYEQQGTPFCVNIGEGEKVDNFVCRECIQNCDCVLDKYCVKKLGSSRGNCKDIEKDKINTACNNFDELELIGRLIENPKTPIYGIDDKLVCGIPVFLNDSKEVKFEFYEWLGSCMQGKCKLCTPVGPTYTQELDFMMQDQKDSLFCPGPVCIGGQLQLGSYAIDPEEFHPLLRIQTVEGINGAILAFVVILCFFNLIMCVCSVRASRNPRKYKKMTQQL